MALLPNEWVSWCALFFIFYGRCFLGRSLLCCAKHVWSSCRSGSIRDSQRFPSPWGQGSAATALARWLFSLHCVLPCIRTAIAFELPGAGGKAKALRLSPTPHVPGADLRNFCRSFVAKAVSRRANAHCPRPQAEFARSSGRGRKRVE